MENSSRVKRLPQHPVILLTPALAFWWNGKPEHQVMVLIIDSSQQSWRYLCGRERVRRMSNAKMRQLLYEISLIDLVDVKFAAPFVEEGPSQNDADYKLFPSLHKRAIKILKGSKALDNFYLPITFDCNQQWYREGRDFKIVSHIKQNQFRAVMEYQMFRQLQIKQYRQFLSHITIQEKQS